MKRITVLFGFCFLLCGFAFGTDPTLQAVFDEDWNFRLQEDPLFATSAGNHKFDDRLPSVTKTDWERRNAFYQTILQKLNRIDRAQLNRTDQISYDLLKQDLQDNISEFEFQTYLIPLNADSGFHTEFARLPRQMTLLTVKDYQNYIARLRAFRQYVNQNIGLMREGIRIGMTLPRVVLDGFEVTVSSHIVEDPAKSIFYAPLSNFPASIPAAEHGRLRETAKSAIREGVVAGYSAFLGFMKEEYLPKTRDTIAASELPNGRKYYEYLVRHFTTLDMTPEQVHQTGLSEVKRIRSEMEGIIRSVRFQGDFAAFLQFLRTDPRFYPKTPEDLLKEASFIAKKMDG
ncbi:MAG TPA: DUF885 domain-containing protein, partial [Acidobacteriota bacterium]|nr:DUF885 domain-containing protein [Acidobacteriota bacterium]